VSQAPVPSGRFVPNGIVTLLTDFGSREPFTGAMKGRILSACPGARIVDLTHELTAYRVAEASFWIERLRLDFPAGTVHLVIVDPGVGTQRRLIAVELDGQVLIGPDNGLLGGLAGSPGARVRAVSPGLLASLNPAPSATFHGRDLFAPLAGALAAGRIDFGQIGSEVSDAQPSVLPQARRGLGSVEGEVLLVDRYGNLFSNIEINSNELFNSEAVIFGGRALAPVRTYGEALPGSCVALVNAFGVVEAACVEGHAAQVLGLGPGDAVAIRLAQHAPADPVARRGS
jgi:S-adenosyl-L-methionine hydrolase (adenosine-forming)